MSPGQNGALMVSAQSTKTPPTPLFPQSKSKVCSFSSQSRIVWAPSGCGFTTRRVNVLRLSRMARTMSVLNRMGFTPPPPPACDGSRSRKSSTFLHFGIKYGHQLRDPTF
ncbi:MAG: Hda108 [Caudoviricetes sp.]|nr:MAG: Hda108 [Caudoviricetes sp.]